MHISGNIEKNFEIPKGFSLKNRVWVDIITCIFCNQGDNKNPKYALLLKIKTSPLGLGAVLPLLVRSSLDQEHISLSKSEAQQFWSAISTRSTAVGWWEARRLRLYFWATVCVSSGYVDGLDPRSCILFLGTVRARKKSKSSTAVLNWAPRMRCVLQVGRSPSQSNPRDFLCLAVPGPSSQQPIRSLLTSGLWQSGSYAVLGWVQSLGLQY